MIVIILPFAIIGSVFSNYDTYYRKSLVPWSHAVEDYHHGDDWWYDIGGQNSDAFDFLYATSPYYRWFKNAQLQYDMFAPAKHVGKINREKFLNPELNLPADRAFGDPYHSDFYEDEMRSGAFEYRPRGQKIVARKVDVDAGIATHVGAIIRLPAPLFVKKDGTLLVSVPRGNRADPHDACSSYPNPCSVFPAKSRCSHFDDDLVECSGAMSLKLRLRWIDPVDDGTPNIVNLNIVPARNYEGSPCESFAPTQPSLIGGDTAACGVTMSANYEAEYPNRAEEEAFFHTLDDGTSRQDYSYTVYAFQGTRDYYLNQGRLELTVFEETNDGYKAVQHITVPDGASINKQDNWVFFFGCLRPDANKIDMKYLGFYFISGNIKDTGLKVYDPMLCEKLRKY